MIRKFNYTNRIKIPRDSVSVSINSIGGKSSFNATLSLEDLALPENSRVYIEPYYGANYLRFSFGSIGSLTQPRDTDITELKKLSEKLYFRIKIVDEHHDNGMLLGFADKLPLVGEDEPANYSTILYVNPVEMDTNEIWRVNFETDSDGMPTLEVNNKVDGIKEMAKTDPRFVALVFPAAIRIILGRIIQEDNYDKEGESWTTKWIKFTEQTLGVKTTPENGEHGEEILNSWVDDCVGAFCVRHKSFENFSKVL